MECVLLVRCEVYNSTVPGCAPVWEGSAGVSASLEPDGLCVPECLSVAGRAWGVYERPQERGVVFVCVRARGGDAAHL